MKKVTWKIYISSHFFQMLNHLPKKDYFFVKESRLRNWWSKLLALNFQNEEEKWSSTGVSFLTSVAVYHLFGEKKKKGTSEKLKSFTSPLWSTLLGKSNMQIWSVSRKNSDSLCSQGNTTPKLTTPYHTVWPGLLFLLVFLHWTLIWAWGSPGLKGNLFRREQKMTSSPSYSVHHSQKPTLYNYLQYSEHTTAIFVYNKSSGYLW